jgi:hypothetical protein
MVEGNQEERKGLVLQLCCQWSEVRRSKVVEVVILIGKREGGGSKDV